MLTQKTTSSDTLVTQLFNRDKFTDGDKTVFDLVQDSIDPSDTIEWKTIDLISRLPDINPKEAIVELLANSEDAHRLIKSNNPNIILRPTGDSSGKGCEEYSLEVVDDGQGVKQENFEGAFFENPRKTGVNKREKPELIGQFGKGSLGAIPASKQNCKLVISSHVTEKGVWKWTLTRKNKEKGVYEYLTINGEAPTYTGSFTVNGTKFTHGTITKIFDVDSRKVPDTITKGSYTRKLGYKYPSPETPITIIDNRADTITQNNTKEWPGFKSELEQFSNFSEFTKTVSVEEMGSMSVSAMVADEDADIPTKFMTTNTTERVFFMLNGITHHTMNHTELKNKFGLSNLKEDCFVFIECSTLEFDFTDIFKTDRTKMLTEKSKAAKLLNTIQQTFKNWTALQQLNKERFTPDERAGQDNIAGLTIEDTEQIYPEYTVANNETLPLTVTANAPERYMEQDYVSVQVKNVTGDVDYTVSGNTIEIAVSPDFQQMDSKQNIVVIVQDLKENTTKQTSFVINRDKSESNIDKDSEDVEEYLEKLSETSVDTRIGYDNFIDQDRIKKLVEERQTSLKALEDISTDKTHNMRFDLAKKLLTVNNKSRFIRTIFRLLGCSQDPDTYLFKEKSWNVKETTEQLNAHNTHTAVELADALLKIGLKELLLYKDNCSTLSFGFVLLLYGMESHKRKNRQGDLFEGDSEEALQSIVDQSDRDLQVITQHKIDFSLDGTKKQVDLALADGTKDVEEITKEDIVAVAEVNFYSTSGSKPSEMSRSTQNQVQNCSEENIKFIRITDGAGLSKKDYRQAYHSAEGNLYNLQMLEETDLEELLED